MKTIQRLILLCCLFSCGFKAYTQEKALEIYMRKNPSKKYIVKVDDRVLIKCRYPHTRLRKQQLIIARLGAIDDKKMYFNPINNHYKETIYTTSRLREIGIKTKLKKIQTLAFYAGRIYDAIRFKDYVYSRWDDDFFYKRVNIKSSKWSARLIDLPND